MTATRPTRPADPGARGTLDKATAENFPVAPFFLPRASREHIMALYGYARLVDDIGDGDLAPGGADARHLGVDPADADDRLIMLDAFEADLRRVFAAPGDGPDGSSDGSGDGPRHPLLRALRPTVRARSLTIEPFLGLIEANRQDQLVTRYETYDELLAYCELSANPVGNLVLQVGGVLSPERGGPPGGLCTPLPNARRPPGGSAGLPPRPVYLPAEDMRRFHVSETDLSAATGNASVRALVAYQADRARRLLDEGAPLVGSVDGRLRLLLAGFVAGGYAALAAIRSAGHDVLPGPPRTARTRLLRETGAVLRRTRKER
ncbi:phytoene synthase [Streptomyces inusitatus]|uniref:Phytoene synthase n=1 Tax=Streptomyces inusitatus TaxID=68221 RepID=A0A918Q7S4_9ACTN|nr:squalene synthase HpnC [Streptomyces inusitatus]GGZ34046.1 phytoene synthase [Streptomyces inusitatus]